MSFRAIEGPQYWYGAYKLRRLGFTGREPLLSRGFDSQVYRCGKDGQAVVKLYHPAISFADVQSYRVDTDRMKQLLERKPLNVHTDTFPFQFVWSVNPIADIGVAQSRSGDAVVYAVSRFVEGWQLRDIEQILGSYELPRDLGVSYQQQYLRGVTRQVRQSSDVGCELVPENIKLVPDPKNTRIIRLVITDISKRIVR